ncbi:hypothetical protein OD754_06780, partial [Rhodobacter capsulatus]|uniref:hypothetical protein n=1 Tax=Rhodobacter capsulatus TaxID=1061 RepID=UPI0028759915
ALGRPRGEIAPRRPPRSDLSVAAPVRLPPGAQPPQGTLQTREVQARMTGRKILVETRMMKSVICDEALSRTVSAAVTAPPPAQAQRVRR